MNIVLFEPGDVTGGEVVLPTTDARAAHMLSILHLVPGEFIRVGLIDGPLGTATLVSTNSREVVLTCTFEETAPAQPVVDLLLAMPRPKVLRRLWAQLAALGVGRIMLTNADRVERHYFDSHVVTPACYRPLLIEGLQQARDTRVPAVSVHRRFRVLVEDDLDRLSDARLRLLADPGARTPPRVTTMDGGACARVLLAVGPEGGWNPFERDLLRAHRFETIGLGPRTLRSDTACVSLLAIVHHELRQTSSGRSAL